MGFDIYGVAPTELTPKPDILKRNFTELSDKEMKEYHDAREQYEKQNPGEYFRNNVWWWRPLWNYVCKTCKDVMTEDQIISGLNNSGFIVDKETVNNMVDILTEAIASDKHKEYEEVYYRELNKLPDEPCTSCKGKCFIYVEAKDKIEECLSCKGTGLRKNWDSNYPFSHENVEKFVKFLSMSGGIQIC
jgi:hypothetical protein